MRRIFENKRLFAIAKKEFIHIFRDMRTLLITFALPVFMLILYGYALTFDIKNIPIAVRDLDNKPMTREIVSKFKSSGYFRVVQNTSSLKQEEEYFLSGKINMAVNFNEGFSANVLSGKGADMQVIVDGSDANTALIALGYMNIILRDYSENIIIQMLSRSGAGRPIKNMPINASPRIWYNSELKSMHFLVPGIISMVLMILAALITSLCIVREKTQGTMEQLIATSVKPMEIMIGKLVPYVAIGFFDVLLCVCVSTIVFKVPIRGNMVFLFVESVIFIIGALGLGLLISTLSRRQEDAILMSILPTMLPAILLSGFVFPIENMPYLIQLITYLVPAKYFLTILRGIFLKGIGLSYLWKETLLLLIFGFFVVYLAALRFKKRLD